MTARPRSLSSDAAVVLGVGAGIAHALLAAEAMREWWEAAVFFGVLAVAQIASAVWLLRRDGRTVGGVLLAAAAHVLSLVVYCISRTSGIPFAPSRGPHGTTWEPGRPVVPYSIEMVGGFDVLTAGIELVALVVLVTLLPAAARQRTSSVLAILAVGLAAMAVASA